MESMPCDLTYFRLCELVAPARHIGRARNASGGQLGLAAGGDRLVRGQGAPSRRGWGVHLERRRGTPARESPLSAPRALPQLVSMRVKR